MKHFTRIKIIRGYKIKYTTKIKYRKGCKMKHTTKVRYKNYIVWFTYNYDDCTLSIKGNEKLLYSLEMFKDKYFMCKTDKIIEKTINGSNQRTIKFKASELQYLAGTKKLCEEIELK